MSSKLELADIQGGILTAYGRLGFPKARYLLLHVRDAAAGRAAIEFIRQNVTTALRWPSRSAAAKAGPAPTGAIVVPRPAVTINLAFTFTGLLALGVPTRTLRGFPDDFIDGMAARAAVLGDNVATNDLSAWDPVWLGTGEKRPHVLVMLNAQMQDDGSAVPELAAATQAILDHVAGTNGGISVLSGHKGASADWQELSALLDGQHQAIPSEHFGFIDAIGDPAFEGQLPDHAAKLRAVGNGKVDGSGNWAPLATGEFLLGWPDEAQEIPGAAMPIDFGRNGTFFAYRKLHQDVAAFDGWIDRSAVQLGAVWDIADTVAARETLRAKLAGRWSDGVPLMAAPDFAAWEAFNRQFPVDGSAEQLLERANRFVDFRFRDDPAGVRCPVTSHLRRMNTRDMLDPVTGNADPKQRSGSALNNRRRILRRGLPYGTADSADGEHGIVMLAVCASLSRQFEFVQQQWINYGLDFGAGNDTCPLVGNHGPGAKFVIPADPASGNPPFIATGMPQFVSTRGGDYFFVPSMTALRMIGMGVVDPT